MKIQELFLQIPIRLGGKQTVHFTKIGERLSEFEHYSVDYVPSEHVYKVNRHDKDSGKTYRALVHITNIVYAILADEESKAAPKAPQAK